MSYLQALDESCPFPFGFPEIQSMQSLAVKPALLDRHHCWAEWDSSTMVSGHHMMLSFGLSRLNCGCGWAMLMPEFSAHKRDARPWWIAQYAGWKRCQVPVLVPSGRARRGEKQTALGQEPFSIFSRLFSCPLLCSADMEKLMYLIFLVFLSGKKRTLPWVSVNRQGKGLVQNLSLYLHLV